MCIEDVLDQALTTMRNEIFPYYLDHSDHQILLICPFIVLEKKKIIYETLM
jgi:hypothetical protein